MRSQKKEAKRAIKRLNKARDAAVVVTCPASRHAAILAEELLLHGKSHFIEDEPYHAAETFASTVQSLWEARARIAELEKHTE